MKKIIKLIFGLTFLFCITSCSTDDGLSAAEVQQLIEESQQNTQQSLDSITNLLNQLIEDLNEIEQGQLDQDALIENLTSLINQLINDVDGLEGNILDQLEDILDQLENFEGTLEDLEDLIQEILDQLDDLDTNENELTVFESSNNPDASVLEVEDNDESDAYSILVFNAEVDEDSQDLEAQKIILSISTPGSAVNDVIDDLELRIGTEDYDDFVYLTNSSESSVIVEFDLSNEDIIINADEEIEISLFARFEEAGDYQSNQTVQATVTSLNVDEWKFINELGVELTQDQLNGSAIGNIHTLLVEGGIITLDDTNAEVFSSSSDPMNQNDSGKFEYDVTIEAINETIYLPVNGFTALATDIVDANNGNTSSPGTISINSNAAEITGSDGNQYYRIDSSESFAIDIIDMPGAGSYYSKIETFFVSNQDVTESGFVFSPISLNVDSNDFRTQVIQLEN